MQIKTFLKMKFKPATLDREKAAEPRGTGGAGSRTKDSPSTSISAAPFLWQTFTPTAARVSLLMEHVFTPGHFFPAWPPKRKGSPSMRHEGAGLDPPTLYPRATVAAVYVFTA